MNDWVTRERAEELTQDTFLKAYENIGKIKGELKTQSWLYAITRNLSLDQLRRDRLISFEPVDALIVHPISSSRYGQPEQYAAMREAQGEIREALGRLPANYQQALLDREEHGISCEKVGAGLGISRSAAKSILFRARVALRDEYQRGSPKIVNISDHQAQVKPKEEIMEVKPKPNTTTLNIAANKADIPGYTLDDAGDITPDQYKLAVLLFPVKSERALAGIPQVADRMGKPVPWVIENRMTLSFKLWYENDRREKGGEQEVDIPPTKTLLLDRLDHIPIYSNTSMRERDSVMWFDLTPQALEEKRNQILAADPQSAVSFKETLNGEEVDPMDPKLSLPEVLRLLYDLQKQEDAKTQIKWQIPRDEKIAYKVALENGILEKVHTSFASILSNLPEDYDLERRVAGRLFNEIAILSQRVKLPPTLTLLSDVRTLAFYKKLYPDSELDLRNGLEMAGLIRHIGETENQDSKSNESVTGVAVPDAIAVAEDGLGNLKVAEFHEYTTSQIPGRIAGKYRNYRMFDSFNAPDLLPTDATFVFVFLLNLKIGEQATLSIKRQFKDAVVRSQAIGLHSREFAKFIRTFIKDFRPEPDATLDEITTMKALQKFA